MLDGAKMQAAEEMRRQEVGAVGHALCLHEF